jgi:hypothetical protein
MEVTYYNKRRRKMKIAKMLIIVLFSCANANLVNAVGGSVVQSAEQVAQNNLQKAESLLGGPLPDPVGALTVLNKITETEETLDAYNKAQVLIAKVRSQITAQNQIEEAADKIKFGGFGFGSFLD